MGHALKNMQHTTHTKLLFVYGVAEGYATDGADTGDSNSMDYTHTMPDQCGGCAQIVGLFAELVNASAFK